LKRWRAWLEIGSCGTCRRRSDSGLKLFDHPLEVGSRRDLVALAEEVGLVDDPAPQEALQYLGPGAAIHGRGYPGILLPDPPLELIEYFRSPPEDRQIDVTEEGRVGLARNREVLGGEYQLCDTASHLQRRFGLCQGRLSQSRAALLIVSGGWHIDGVVKPDCGLNLVGALGGVPAQVELGEAVPDVLCGVVGAGRLSVGKLEIAEDGEPISLGAEAVPQSGPTAPVQGFGLPH
jgi:hypothetical protein